MKDTRKCSICANLINIKKQDYLKHNKQYMHTQCFVEKYKNRKKKPLNDSEIEQLINEIKLNMDNEIKAIMIKDEFFDYIQSFYDITYVPNYTFIKVSEIVNGTYKGLKEGILYEDLLYMFKSKRDFLNKNADKKIRQGNEFKDGISRFNYDLAVVISKYDSYKQWKEKQKLLEVEKEKILDDINNKIDFKYINSIGNNAEDSEEVNISDLLDEI